MGRVNRNVIENEDENSSTWSSDEISKEIDFYETLTIVLKVRSTPGPVTRLSVRLSTILGVLMWEFSSNYSGGYPIRSFTAEMREYVDLNEINATEKEWHQFDPQNIPSNVVS